MFPETASVIYRLSTAGCNLGVLFFAEVVDACYLRCC